MALIFLNRFYWPDEPATAQLLTDLAEALAADGENVFIITSHNGHASTPREETRNGVRIRRVRGTHLGKKKLAGRVIDFVTFSIGALFRLFRTVRRNDTLVAMTDPPLLGIAATTVSRLRGAHVVHWIQDIYPELAVTLTGVHGLRFLKPLRDRAWRHAETCVAVGEDMADFLRARGVQKTTVIQNWAPAGLAPIPLETPNGLREAWGLHGKFIVAYSGNLGRVHDLAPLLDAAAALSKEPDIVFVFIGDGAQKGMLEASAQKRALGNVRFFPPQPRARLAETLGLGDVHFVTLLPGCEQLVFPSKFYGIAAVGRPMLFVGPRDCTLAGIVTRHGMGAAFAREDTVALAETIRALRGDAAWRSRCAAAAAKFYQESASFEHAIAAWRKILHISA